MPAIACVARQGPWSHFKTKLDQLKELLALGSKALVVPRHRLLHLNVWPGARAMARPFGADSRFRHVEVLGDGEDLGIVGDAVRHFFARRNVTRVALRVDAGCLLGVGFSEKTATGGFGLLPKPSLLRTHGNLDDAISSPGVYQRLPEGPVTGGPCDTFWHLKGDQLSNLGLESGRHGCAWVCRWNRTPWGLWGIEPCELGFFGAETGRYGHASYGTCGVGSGAHPSPAGTDCPGQGEANTSDELHGVHDICAV